MSENRRQQGFTLLEILAALVIVAIGIAAMSKVIGNAASILQANENRLIGTWVASNRLTEIRLSRIWPAAAETDLEASMGGRPWYIREKITTTTDPDLLRVDIEVYTDQDHTRSAAKLFGYLARFTPTDSGDDHGDH